MKKLALLFILCGALFGAKPVYAAVTWSDVLPPHGAIIQNLNPVFTLVTPEAMEHDCTSVHFTTAVLDKNGVWKQIFLGVGEISPCTGIFPIHWNDLYTLRPITHLDWGDSYAVRFTYKNGAESSYVQHEHSSGNDPVIYKMNTAVASSAGIWMSSMGSGLLSMIVLGISIVSGVIVTLFGLRWLIRFVRRFI